VEEKTEEYKLDQRKELIFLLLMLFGFVIYLFFIFSYFCDISVFYKLINLLYFWMKLDVIVIRADNKILIK
jgi:hypothetical protein